jgi:hypothetical protein
MDILFLSSVRIFGDLEVVEFENHKPTGSSLLFTELAAKLIQLDGELQALKQEVQTLQAMAKAKE